MGEKEKFTVVIEVNRKKGKYSFFVKTPYWETEEEVVDVHPDFNEGRLMNIIDPVVMDLRAFVREEAL